MAYWNSKKNASSAQIDNFGLGTSKSSTENIPFYEFEPAVVLDIILDETHPIFKKNVIDDIHWPPSIENKKPDSNDSDYTWVGKILARMLYTQKNVEKEELIWAYPLESNISEFPLIHELVMVSKYENKYFYSKKVNIRNLPNQAIDFRVSN